MKAKTDKKSTVQKSKMKKCAKCSKSKPVKEFCKKKRNPDGLNSWCGKCNSEYQQARRISNGKSGKPKSSKSTKSKTAKSKTTAKKKFKSKSTSKAK